MQKVKGFTLAELMLAVAILLVVLVSILATYISCILLNQSNHNLVVASTDAQYILEQIRGLTYDEISNYINNLNPNFFSNLPNETVKCDDCLIGSRIADITMNVSWQESKKIRSFLLKTKIYRYANTL
ncbi:MAG: prepilin-type N-terminal cleavage/methylation domain-containing protein [Candidatus Omnitrophica bacterium]|nr:prepilin-type N-terminal cleavage/methylation domain-containing protein [Candidatus Omnitrophota bacterium]